MGIDIRGSGGGGGGTVADADATTKGKVQLAGDLGGTAASPTVVGVQANVITPAMMEHGTRGDILTYNGSGGPPTRLAKGTTTYVLTAGADDVSWAAPAGGVPTTLGPVQIIDGSATGAVASSQLLPNQHNKLWASGGYSDINTPCCGSRAIVYRNS